MIKIGGSLLLRRSLTTEIQQWFREQSVAENVVIIGGGRLVDAVRQLDQVRSTDPIVTHWLCVDLLRVTGRMFHSWCDWHLIADRQSLMETVDAGFPVDRPCLIDVGAFYDPDHDFGAPQNWQTTSDTIAAILARVVRADELVLLKAARIHHHGTTTIAGLKKLADSGIVDSSLVPILAETPEVHIRIETLR